MWGEVRRDVGKCVGVWGEIRGDVRRGVGGGVEKGFEDEVECGGQGRELDRFLIEFERYLQARVGVLRILFFEFGKNERIQRV